MGKDQTNGKGALPLMVGIGVQDFTPDPPADRLLAVISGRPPISAT